MKEPVNHILSRMERDEKCGQFYPSKIKSTAMKKIIKDHMPHLLSCTKASRWCCLDWIRHQFRIFIDIIIEHGVGTIERAKAAGVSDALLKQYRTLLEPGATTRDVSQFLMTDDDGVAPPDPVSSGFTELCFRMCQRDPKAFQRPSRFSQQIFSRWRFRISVCGG
jgi:hypothetical protein